MFNPPPSPESNCSQKNLTSLLVVDVRTPEAESLSRLGWYTSLAIMFSASVTFWRHPFFRNGRIGAMNVSNKTHYQHG